MNPLDTVTDAECAPCGCCGRFDRDDEAFEMDPCPEHSDEWDELVARGRCHCGAPSMDGAA